MDGPPRKYRIGEDLEPWEGGSVFGSSWGYTPPGWLMKVCIGCSADLETWNPATVKPMFEDDFCRPCAAKEKCPTCGGTGHPSSVGDVAGAQRLTCPDCRGRGLWPEHLRRARR